MGARFRLVLLAVLVRIFGRVRRVDVNIFVDIRRLRPSRRQLRAAQRVVSSVRFS